MKKISVLTALCLIIAFFAQPAMAEGISEAVRGEEKPDISEAAPDTTSKEADKKGGGKQTNNDFFSDGSWGIGLAILKHERKVIKDASIENGIVRVNDEQLYAAKLLITRHWYLASDDKQCKEVPLLGTCIGPFLSVGLGDNQIIDMVGGGIVLGFGNPKNQHNSQDRDHNVGIGWSREFHVKVLGDGFSENSAPPPGETQVRYKYTDINAPFLFYTHRW